MPAPDFNTLLEEAKCYLCLGISQAEALELALLARISEGGGGGGSGQYEINLGMLQGLAFADNTIYYIGLLSAAATAAFYTTGFSSQYFKITRPGTVSRATISFRRNSGAVPTAELMLVELHRLRAAGPTDLVIKSYQISLVSGLIEDDFTSGFSNSDLIEGDYIWLQLSCPAWVTNPGSTVVNVRLIIDP